MERVKYFGLISDPPPSAAESFDKKSTSIFGTKSKKAMAAMQEETTSDPPTMDVIGRSRSNTSTRRNSVFSSLFTPEQPPKSSRREKRGDSSGDMSGEGSGGVLTATGGGVTVSGGDLSTDELASLTHSSPGNSTGQKKELVGSGSGGLAGVASFGSAPVIKSPRVMALKEEEGVGEKEKGEKEKGKKKEKGHKRMGSVGSAGRAKGRRLSIFGSVMGAPKKDTDAEIVLDIDEAIRK